MAEMFVQVGEPESALVVLQMPPPAAATQTRQKPPQPLNVSSASPVIRPDTFCVLPVKVRTFGSVAVSPVTSCQKGICGGSGGLGRSIITVIGVGVGAGVPLPLLPCFFFFGVAVGVAGGEGGSVGPGVTVGTGVGVA